MANLSDTLFWRNLMLRQQKMQEQQVGGQPSYEQLIEPEGSRQARITRSDAIARGQGELAHQRGMTEPSAENYASPAEASMAQLGYGGAQESERQQSIAAEQAARMKGLELSGTYAQAMDVEGLQQEGENARAQLRHQEEIAKLAAQKRDYNLRFQEFNLKKASEDPGWRAVQAEQEKLLRQAATLTTSLNKRFPPDMSGRPAAVPPTDSEYAQLQKINNQLAKIGELHNVIAETGQGTVGAYAQLKSIAQRRQEEEDRRIAAERQKQSEAERAAWESAGGVIGNIEAGGLGAVGVYGTPPGPGTPSGPAYIGPASLTMDQPPPPPSIWGILTAPAKPPGTLKRGR